MCRGWAVGTDQYSAGSARLPYNVPGGRAPEGGPALRGAGGGGNVRGDEGGEEGAEGDDLVAFGEVVAGAEEFDVGGGDGRRGDPPLLKGTSWSKWRLSVAPHWSRRGDRPLSRRQTSTLTAVGILREMESSRWSSDVMAAGVVVGRSRATPCTTGTISSAVYRLRTQSDRKRRCQPLWERIGAVLIRYALLTYPLDAVTYTLWMTYGVQPS